MDNHKGVFNVEVVAVSSLHTQVSVKICRFNKKNLDNLLAVETLSKSL